MKKQYVTKYQIKITIRGKNLRQDLTKETRSLQYDWLGSLNTQGKWAADMGKHLLYIHTHIRAGVQQDTGDTSGQGTITTYGETKGNVEIYTKDASLLTTPYTLNNKPKKSHFYWLTNENKCITIIFMQRKYIKNPKFPSKVPSIPNLQTKTNSNSKCPFRVFSFNTFSKGENVHCSSTKTEQKNSA